MSSFQFPANPSDGDIVVRGNLQAFYNAATNTWRVSEVPTAPGIPGPPGPPGPEGPPGKGVEVSGVVDTFADLPAENAHQFEYWVVSDTNTLYISDGIQWVALGGPIQGPQGEPGEDGQDGTNGQNGRGWYDTNIIDQRPNNYQVQFLSNDGLGFTTDNIMGPQGASGTIPVASETVLGGIKVGRGLKMNPSGTLNANQANVNLETTPLQPGNFALPTTPTYIEFDFETADGSQEAYRKRSGKGPYYETNWIRCNPVTVTMPDTANAAIVTWTAPSTFDTRWANDNVTFVNGATLNFRAYLNHFLYVTGGEIVGRPETTRSMKGIAHNYNPVYFIKSDGTSSILNRYSTNSFNKIEYVTFQPGADVTFQITTDIGDMSTGSVAVGGVRAWIQPFRIEEDLDNPFSNNYILQENWSRSAEIFPTLTDEDIKVDQAADLKSRTIDLIVEIDSLLILFENDQPNLDILNQAKTDALNVINLPGTYEDLSDELSRISNIINVNYLSNPYRFE